MTVVLGRQAAVEEANRDKDSAKDVSAQLEAATARVAELEVALQAAQGDQQDAGARSCLGLFFSYGSGDRVGDSRLGCCAKRGASWDVGIYHFTDWLFVAPESEKLEH